MSAISGSDLDETFNTSSPSCIEFLDYIPIISIISGLARAVFGLAQTLVGLFALPFQLTNRVTHEKNPLLVMEGLSNLVRGIIAVKPIIGNVILYVYDHSTTTKRDIRRSIGIEL